MADDSRGDPGRVLFTSRRGRRRFGDSPMAAFGLLVVFAVVAGAGWLWLRSRRAEEPVLPAVGASVAPGEGESFVLPALGASDAAVRGLVATVSAHPQLAAWLLPDDLVRRFVEAVVDVARGSSPVAPMEMLIPQEPFRVRESGGRLLMDPQSQRRYDLLGDVFTSVDAQAAARVYRQLLPLFREAYQELGVPDEPFEGVLARAIENLLAVEVPERPLEVREAVDRYVYVDGTIESLTPAEKHLIRMGPVNARRIQDKLREISLQLDLLPVDDEAAGDTASTGRSM